MPNPRYLLQFAESWVDESVYGNRKGRQASDLWTSLLQQIEQAYATGLPLAGISADLEKCFNCIPRFPALCLAVLVGTPPEVTTAWSGALSSMCRHFKVRDSYSAGFLTSTGLAEGCGLSVYGMLLVDHLFACWLRFQTPTVQCLTYVDDWQTMTRDPSFAVRQLDLVEQFAGMVDLTVDRKKTFGWATCPTLRAQMRSAGIRVLHHARELGGHFGVSRQYTNRTVTQRIADLEDFWGKLRASRVRHQAKVFMLRAVAWPRGLHAIASAPVGDQVWLDLRRQAVKALGWKKPGVNPQVLLSLVECAVDPQFVALLWTLRSARVHCPLDFWTVSVAPLAHGDLDLPPNSLAAIALHRIQSVGFSVSRQGWVRDCFGFFCPQTCNPTELELRLQWAWTRVVAQKVVHRTDFAGLACADLAATRQAINQLSADDQALYRLSLAGGLFTESYKAKWTEQADACQWCGQKDTLMHRYWECPQHHDLRQQLAPEIPAILDLLPPALSLRGWAIFPPTWPAWIRLLVSLPATPPSPVVAFRLDGWNDVFTDGSCLHQACPLYRCAAWAVTLAPPFTADWTPGGAAVVGASYLPGLCQTAYRAELFAVAYTLHWAAAQGAQVRIWSDCLGVVNKFALLVWGHKRLNPTRSNADLWVWIMQSVERLGKQNVAIMKVPAHRDLRSLTTRFEIWKGVHNAFADRAARLANQARPTWFWKFWEQHVQAVTISARLFDQVRKLHLAVGRRHVQGQVNFSGDLAPTPARPTRISDKHFDVSGWQGQPLPVTSRLFGAALTIKLQRWFDARLVLTADAPLEWVSITQLYVDFQLTWGHPGPLRVHDQWVDVDQRPYLAAETFGFRVRVRWFRQFLKQFWREAQVTLALEQCRPRSEALQTFLPAASVPWDTLALCQVETWITAQLNAPCVRSASVLKSLPLASRDPTMAMAVMG